MTASPRILVGQIWHEGHSFNPVVTERDDMAVVRGDEMLAEARASRTSLSGIVAVCDALGYTCVPTLSARARPGGPVSEPLFQEILAEIAATAMEGGYDAVCIDLHGATIAEETGDTEGAVLTRLREIVGPAMPIGVALDLHGYITPAMIDAATILTGYRTQPHSDIYETGERAMRLIDRVMREGTPRAVAARLPFITLGSDETSAEPLRSLCAVAEEWRTREDLLDLSMFNIHPFINLPEMGQMILAYDFGDGCAMDACRDMAERLWELRTLFREQLPSVEEALDLARESDILLALGDQGDRVVGAGPGDSPYIAEVALRHAPDLKVATNILDPAAVAAAEAAGEGATLDIAIGASINTALTPLRAAWRVERLRPARFRNSGPYMNGVAADFGPAAVLTTGNVTAIVTTRAPNVHDPAFYDAMGVPVAGQDVVVARAANHYKLSFRDCARCITVDTPGLTAFRADVFDYDRARPFYPLDNVDWSFPASVRTYHAAP